MKTPIYKKYLESLLISLQKTLATLKCFYTVVSTQQSEAT